MNKPHIWIDDLGTWFTDTDYQNLDESLQDGLIPLYTHPVKELTDEEIIDIYRQIGGNKEWAIGGMNDAIPFAKAILRKAQEK